MANFHKNQIVIAADEADMMNVLKTFAYNLTSHQQQTSFSNLLDDVTSIKDAWSALSSLEYCYPYAFVPHPNYPENIQADSNTEDYDYIPDDMRPLSESGFTILSRYGKTYVMYFWFDTAWNPCLDSVDYFLASLPKGRYGVTYLDADEYDGFKSNCCQTGLYTDISSEESELTERRYSSNYDLGDINAILSFANDNKDVDLATCDKLSEVSLIYSCISWLNISVDSLVEAMGKNPFDQHDVKICSSLIPEIHASDYQSIDKTTSGHLFDYQDEEDDEYTAEVDIHQSIPKVLERFPLVMSIEGTRYEGRIERIEDIQVGDSVVLASDWTNPYFSPCAIEVFNERGKTLGNLSIDYFLSNNHLTLGLLLPYTKATVASVTPLSQRRRGSKYALMDVKIELNESDIEDLTLEDLMAKAEQMLNVAPNERITMSDTPLSVLNLKGYIDVSYMSDDNYIPIEDTPSEQPVKSEFDFIGFESSPSYIGLNEALSRDVLDKLESFNNTPISGREFVSTSEVVVGQILISRNRDLDKIVAKGLESPNVRERFVKKASQYNYTLLECFAFYIQIINNQLEMKALPQDLVAMLSETNEILDIIQDVIEVTINDFISPMSIPIDMPIEYNEVVQRYNKLCEKVENYLGID